VSCLMLHLIVVEMGEDTHRVLIPASFSIAVCQCQIQSAAARLIYIQTHIVRIDERILCYFPSVLCECEAVTLINGRTQNECVRVQSAERNFST
jgi:hypothetical protein